MAKFRVWARSIDWLYVDVEAETKEQAYEVAEELDGAEFHTAHGYGDWEMKFTDVDELDNDDEVDYTYKEVFE